MLQKESNRDQSIAIIVIGRNEGSILRYSLSALLGSCSVLYVDSGSTDGSVELAESLGITVHQLDQSTPFSAARARREGVEVLLSTNNKIKYIQFVDGDCELESEWVSTAFDFLKNNQDVAIVTGQLEERDPGDSIYNWLSSLQWNAPSGDIAACGGIFMIRKDVYIKTGGFNAALLTREERDLCRRVKETGYRIVRLDTLMAKHDSGLLSFHQWWSRAVWGGYGDALQIGMKNTALTKEQRQRIRRYLMWPLIIPFIAIGGLVGSVWLDWLISIPLFCLFLYFVLYIKLFIYRIRMKDSFRTSFIFAVFKIIRKFAAGYGFALYFIQKNNKKRPDPHAATH